MQERNKINHVDRSSHAVENGAGIEEVFFWTWVMKLEILSNARESYVTFLREQIKDYQRKKEFLAAEVLIQPDESDNPPPFCLLRADIIAGSASDPQVIRIADREPSSVSVQRYKISSCLQVEASSVSWECCCITFRTSGFRLELLEPWLVKWMDTNELNSEDEHGLNGVVHSLNWSSDNRGNWELIVDFGSASTDALDDLLQILASQGVRKCTVAVGSDDEG